MRWFRMLLFLALGSPLLRAQQVPPAEAWTGVSPDRKWLATARVFPDAATFWNGDLDHTRLLIADNTPNLSGARYVAFDLPRLIDRIQWSPDSHFLVLTTSSPGGHSPWHAETYVYIVADRTLRAMDDAVGLVLRSDFSFAGPHAVTLALLRPGHDPVEDEPRRRTVDLEQAYSHMPRIPSVRRGRLD